MYLDRHSGSVCKEKRFTFTKKRHTQNPQISIPSRRTLSLSGMNTTAAENQGSTYDYEADASNLVPIVLWGCLVIVLGGEPLD